MKKATAKTANDCGDLGHHRFDQISDWIFTADFHSHRHLCGDGMCVFSILAEVRPPGATNNLADWLLYTHFSGYKHKILCKIVK